MKSLAHRLAVVAGGLLPGVLSVLLGFGIWFAVLPLSVADTFVRGSLRHEGGGGLGEWAMRLAYGGAFFLSAFLIGRVFRGKAGVLSGFMAYVAFLAVYIPWLDRPGTEWTLFAPLVALPLGAWLAVKPRRLV
jgi:hypothetical protein